ncbi:GDNF-inducible zinc finger protein 1 [Syngnathus scovelli]|uniref:GDNF-inducible zinc finger protein 1 n=1 Tax=Syngnathus scovelli TaxID=161590 RepID=UPI00210FB44A|nr:GDNF-inducible zinc finger protein 1 isoform X3 [Syngnathus scovelli]XP_049612056.1 GDNF-inducible zinc finger protein 1 isoform X3 [Syngnathus scovelli]XP_049612057.1 GDNF-inducible zinc finger protein 1 isoform X3 [Syngnathus scovelli]
MGTEVIQLSSQTHHQNILNALHHLRLQGHLSDITVQVDYQGHAQTFQAHRVVLAASSDYFRNIFLSLDATPDQITLSNMHPCDFSDFLEFVYTGKAEVAQSRMEDMQAAAKILKCEELARVCGINHTSQSDVVESSPATETGIKKQQNHQLPPESSECLSKISKRKRSKLKWCIPTEDEAFNAEEDNDTTYASSSHFDKDTQSLNDAEETVLVSAGEDDDESGMVSKRTSKRKFLCNDCQRSFHYERSYRKHVSTCQALKGKLVHQCKTCMKTFSNRSSLRLHEKHVHSSERLSTCDVCAKTFKRKKDVARHKKLVHDGPHMCSECGKWLRSKASLMLHTRMHRGIKNYVCTKCGSRFVQKSALNMHERSHTDEKPFACDMCDARFKQRNSLAYHKRSHMGEKPFKCEICGKGFAAKEYLRNHTNVHTGAKPFKCKYCGRNFGQRNSLRQHLAVHTGERPYACNDCGKHFTQLNALKRHQRIHTGEKPYMCVLCSRTFTDTSTLRRHTKIHDANAPWKNYLVVLEGNVEKESKAQDKLEAQVVTSDSNDFITLDRPFYMPVEEISSDTPSMSSLMEEVTSQTILAPQEEEAQPNILTVVVSEEM